MGIADLLPWLAALALIPIGFTVARGLLRLRSVLKIRRAGERPLHSVTAAIWRDPGFVESLDLGAGPGGLDGSPTPPFTFVQELFTGSRPGVAVRDARGRTWRIKWGDEVQVEALATRLAWAAGYFVETTYFVQSGTIEGVAQLQRAAKCVDRDGTFANARFELDQDGVIKHFDEHSWAWNDNPFAGSRELNGLKIVMMWLSNWDAKDVRDVALGSNTAIFEYPRADGRREARYLVIDWGGALGRWGNIVQRGRWDPAGFEEQTAQLVQGVDGEFVRWGYSGQRTPDITDGIRVSDVVWLLGFLARLQRQQIGAAVRASGGTPEEEERFTRALLARLDRLREVTVSTSDTSAVPATKNLPRATEI
jgi:hypothetical protein